MSSFTQPLTVTKISARKWKVEREFEYHIGSEDSNEIITVPKGFMTDFASVPRLFWIILPPDGRYTQAAVLHDYILKIKLYSYSKSDRIMLEAMTVLKVSWWKRHLMYRALRIWHVFKK